MVDALDKSINKFRCHYTGLVLEEHDTKSPFYLTFDHVVPGDNSKLVCSARFVNELKSSMSETEFRNNIPLLSDHFEKGTSIDKNAFKMEFFRKKAKKDPVLPKDKQLRAWKSDVCLVCGKEPLPKGLYCKRCRGFLLGQYDRAACREAIKQAYDKAIDGFRCHYTGAVIDTENIKSPWYLCFDHVNPSKPGKMAVTAMIINNMKTELSDTEFIAVVKELAHHFRTGEPYNRDIIKFEYWTRPRLARGAAR
jgi:5-methylcytosine-specific restriction endonuclease McrA